MEFELHDLVTVGVLVFLEGVLSVDNAVVLALLARQVKPHLRKKALTYGLIGAVGFRILALAFASHLMEWNWVKYVGGGYLIFVAGQHWFKKNEDSHKEKKIDHLSFWRVVLIIEMTDIAFAIDSILAAVAISQKLWVVLTGGIIGLILMRFAASWFMKLLDRFPTFEESAYLLVALVGVKLVVDGLKIPSVNFHSSDSPAFWIFWILLVAAIAYGFRKKKA